MSKTQVTITRRDGTTFNAYVRCAAKHRYPDQLCFRLESKEGFLLAEFSNKKDCSVYHVDNCGVSPNEFERIRDKFVGIPLISDNHE